MNDDYIYKILRTILTVFLLLLLWPLIKWFIILVIALIAYVILTSKRQKVRIKQEYDRHQQDYYQDNNYSYKQTNDDDIIDVTYKEK